MNRLVLSLDWQRDLPHARSARPLKGCESKTREWSGSAQVEQRGKTVLFRTSSAGARFSKEVQPTLSLNLNSELTYTEMRNSEFSVDSEFSACTTTMKSHDQWSSEITIHHGNSSRQKDVSVHTSVNA